MKDIKAVIQKLKEGDGRTPSQVHATIIGLAGCYLVYLAFDLVTSYKFSEYPLWQAALMVLAIIAFVLFGIYFALQGWFEYKRFRTMPLDDFDVEDEPDSPDKLPEDTDMSLSESAEEQSKEQ